MLLRAHLGGIFVLRKNKLPSTSLFYLPIPIFPYLWTISCSELGSRRARCEAESKLQPKASLAILRRKGMKQASARHAMIYNAAHFEEGLEKDFPGR